MAIFLQWAENKLLNEVRTQRGGVSYNTNYSSQPINTQSEETPAGDTTEETFLGLQQRPHDWVYFGIFLLEDKIEKMQPGEKLRLNLEDIKPYCGPIIWVDDNKDNLYVGPPNKKGGIRSLMAREVKRGMWKGNLLVKISDLENFSSYIEGVDRNVWLYVGNNYQRGVVQELRKKDKGGSQTQLSPQELEQHATNVKNDFYGFAANQKQNIPTLDDLAPNPAEPAVMPQMQQAGDVPYMQIQQSEPTPQIRNLFGPSRTLTPEPTQAGSPLASRIKPGMPLQNQTMGMNINDRRRLKRNLDVAWSQPEPLKYEKHWSLMSEIKTEYPYYPEY